MNISESSPKWVQEQVRKGLNIDKKLNIKDEIQKLSAETLIKFFTDNRDATFSKDGSMPENGAAHITAYQKALNLLGESTDIDGIWGQKTQAALQKFQKANGLKPDGIPGPKTAAKIIEKLNEKNAKPPETLTAKPIEEKEEESKEKTKEEKANIYLKEKGYILDEKGNYINPDKDLTIMIKNGTVERTRNIGRVFGSWELSDEEREIIANLSKILEK